jgi:hypothetical protein
LVLQMGQGSPADSMVVNLSRDECDSHLNFRRITEF